MHLDVQTLAVVTAFITALLGGLLVFAGTQNRSIRAPLWWGGAHIVNAGGLGLLAAQGAAPAIVTSDVANALVLFGYGLMWSGARVFDGRKVSLPLVALAPAIWLGLCRLPAFADPDLRVVVVSTMLAFLACRAAEELWRGRNEPLMSRWPSVIVFSAYATMLLARVPVALLAPSLQDDSLMRGLSFSFGTLLFTVVVAFLQLNMTKERTELSHRTNAQIDPLSGVANRRAFLDRAANLIGQQEIEREPLAVLLFDLDHFKEINDQLGHAVGDAVLQAFAATATKTLGADILFARIGSEEFAACLPVGDTDEAYAVADRVRRNFAVAAARFGNQRLAPSVSVGITLRTDCQATVAELLSSVDRALYRAKENGRNRIEVEMPAATDAGVATPSVVPIIGPDRGAQAPLPVSRRWRVAT